MDEEKELWKELSSGHREALSPGRREELVRAGQEVADDPDITPMEAFERGLWVGVKVTGEGMIDILETIKASGNTALKKDKN